METKTANTAPAPAMPTQEELIRYRILSAMLANLNAAQEIDDETQARATAVLAMKAGLRQDSIFI